MITDDLFMWLFSMLTAGGYSILLLHVTTLGVNILHSIAKITKNILVGVGISWSKQKNFLCVLLFERNSVLDGSYRIAMIGVIPCTVVV
jgi:hypothetical protein